MSETVVQSPPKADPETLVLRARPPRAIRFRRGVIIAIAAIGSVSLVAVTWMALSPRLFHRAQGQEELSQPDTRSPADARSEEHTSELQSLMRISYAVFCLTKKTPMHYRT